MSATQGPGRDAPETNPPSTSPRPARRWLGWSIAAAVACAVIALIYLRTHQVPSGGQGGGRRGAAAAMRNGSAMPVRAATAATGDLNVYINGLGTVTPAASVVVHSRVDGQLMKVHFTEGQMVKAGDLLAEIDPRPFQAALLQAQGQLVRDQALLQNARLDLQRYQTLAAQDSIARQQLDTQKSLVQQYEGTVKADQGNVDNARLQLTYANVTAPVSGRVGLRQVDPGNIVHASDTNGLVIINQVQPISVVFSMPEDNLARVMQRLQAGDTLPVDAFDRQQTTLLASGKLLTVDNQIDTATGTVKLKAQFNNEKGALFPNQFVNARLLVDTLHGVTLIPTAAVQRGTQGTFVYAVQPDHTIKLKVVKLGPSDAARVVVESGVAPGEQLVIDGMDQLRDGSKVDIIVPGAASAPAAPAAGSAAQANKQAGQHRQRKGAP